MNGYVKTVSIVAMSLIIATGNGCDTKSDNDNIESIKPTLTMKPWNWVETVYNNDTKTALLDTTAFVLTFLNDSTFSATTDCNNMHGKYILNNNQISFGSIAITKKYCENSQEDEFLSTLEATQSYFFTENAELIFDLKYDSGSARFR